MDEAEARVVLGIAGELTAPKVKKARNAKIKNAHPDIGGNDVTATEVNQAFEILNEILSRVNRVTFRRQDFESKTSTPKNRDSNGSNSSKKSKTNSSHSDGDSPPEDDDSNVPSSPTYLCSACFIGNLEAALSTPAILTGPLEIRYILFEIRNLLDPSKIHSGYRARFPGEKTHLVSENLMSDVLRSRTVTNSTAKTVWKILVEIFGSTSLTVCSHQEEAQAKRSH